MNKSTDFVAKHWRVIVGVVIAGTMAFFLIFFPTLVSTNGFSPTEIAVHNQSTSLKAIWHNPINAPFKLLTWLPFKLGFDTVTFTRLISGTMVLVAGVLFYFIKRQLISRRIAVLSTILFATSTSFLTIGHVGSPVALQILAVLIALILLPVYQTTETRKPIIAYLTVVVLAAMFYIPSAPWFILAGLIALNKRIVTELKKVSAIHKIILIVLFFGLITPLILSFVRQPELILVSLGLPNALPTLAEIGHRARNFALLFYHAAGSVELVVVKAPIITLAELALAALGVLVQLQKPIYRRNIFLLVAAAFFILLSVVGGEITHAPLVPIIYILIGSGLYYLYKQWLTVFPRNPVARSVGTTLLVILVASSVVFHVRAVFYAWPNSTATKNVFNQPQPKYVRPER